MITTLVGVWMVCALLWWIRRHPEPPPYMSASWMKDHIYRAGSTQPLE